MGITRYTILWSLTLTLTVSIVSAISPNELKPCFERYNGFKIVEATPFHSEWRMKSEEQCLEFCVRSSSRCVSIVYDKYSHICHYFNINAIEEELIVKNPRMVYFQAAEKECIDKKLIQIITEDTNKRVAMHEIHQLQAKNKASNETSESIAVKVTTETIPSTEITTLSTAGTSEASAVGKEGKESLEGNEESILALDTDFDGDPMNFVRLVEDEKVSGSESGYSKSVDTTKASSATTTEETTTTMSTTVSTTTESTTEAPTTTAATKQPVTPKITKPTTTQPPSTEKPIEKIQAASTEKSKISAKTFDAEFPEIPPSFNIISSMDNKIDEIMPVMSGFKVQKKQLPELLKEDFQKKSDYEFVEVRRHPGKNRSPFAKTFDEEDLGQYNIYSENCKGDAQEIWMAVENSQVESGVKSTILKMASQPQECMETCKEIQVGDYPCDSFTFTESSKRCVFHATPNKFSVKPAYNNDFSTRAFKKLCYPANLTPFSDCAEFLAFRDYALDIEHKEIFEGLPANNDGLAACVELCVLSTNFRCKSATFDEQTGICMLYDQHSLSKPNAFKEHQLANQIYFENGCVPASAPIEKEGTKSLAKSERVEPVRLDYRSITH